MGREDTHRVPMVNINECSIMRPGHLCASGSIEAENIVEEDKRINGILAWARFLDGESAVWI